MNTIELSDVKKSFGAFSALNGLSFKVGEGELYGLIGPNGAGKSTAIKIMVGLQRAAAGRVLILGQQPQSTIVRNQVGYMPQETALYLDLTVFENLDLFGRLYGMSKTDRTRRISELLDFIDLGKWAGTVITNLSGGMQHRVSLAVALLAKPKLLVLDEPTVGVDPALRASFWAQFKQMQKDGTTILITTHYMDEAMHCERVGLINNGKLVAEGSPQELIHSSGTKSLEEAFLSFSNKDNRGREARS